MKRLPFSEILMLGTACGVSAFIIGNVLALIFNVEQFGKELFNIQVILISAVSFVIPFVIGTRYINKRHISMKRLEELESTETYQK